MSRPVDINRALRRAGLLEVHTQDGMEYLDPTASRAFAVADHQIAHVYVRRPEDLTATREALSGLPGIGQLLDDRGKKEHGLDHPRAGDLVALAEPDAWFTYYYWLDDARAPDFARLVEIHRKPGYDPAELFMDPRDPYVRLRAAAALARKKLGDALPDGGRPARPRAGPRQPRTAARRPRRRSGPHLLTAGRPAPGPRRHRREAAVAAPRRPQLSRSGPTTVPPPPALPEEPPP